MANFDEIKKIVKLLKKKNFKNFILLHCVSLYPTRINDVNLQRIEKLQKRYKCKIGYSDHTKSISAAISSTFFGSIFLEKHFCDTKIKGVDNDFSSDKFDFKKMIGIIRENDVIMRSNFKKKISKEIKVIKQFRKGVYLNSKIRKMQKIKLGDLKFARPFNGFKIENIQKLIGKRAKKKLDINSNLRFKDFY